MKRKLNVKKKAFLAEQVSAILQKNNALKYKDPGCPTISCFIGEHKIERAYEAPSKTQPHTSSGGMYNLREDHDLQAKFASLARKVEALELKKSGQLKSVQDIVC